MIPLSLPMIAPQDWVEVRKVLESGWLTTGPNVKKFEERLHTRLRTNCIAVSSCTAALHLALEAADLRDQRVIVPTWTFTATAEAIEMAGATPVFCDVSPETLNMTPDTVAEADIELDGTAAGVVPVHMAGLPCDVSGIMKMMGGAPCTVIEDAAHAFGARYLDGARVGTRRDTFAAFSFYATKGLTTLGEGGLVCSPCDQDAATIRRMRFHGVDREAWDRNVNGSAAPFEVVSRGFKYNMSDAQAAMGCSQLNLADDWMHMRRLRVENYNIAFTQYALPIKIPPILPGHSWHLYQIKLLDPEAPQFIEHMRREGVACGMHYLPLHRNRYWREKYHLIPQRFPGAEAAYNRVVSLPLWAGLSRGDQETVIQAVRKYFK